jgi:hypothetical protein
VQLVELQLELQLEINSSHRMTSVKEANAQVSSGGSGI